MSSSQFVDGSNNWRPPSPNSTPHSTKFNNLPFQSPSQQQDLAFNHFENAWVTPRAPASAFASSPTYTTPSFETPTVASNWDGQSPTVVTTNEHAAALPSTTMAGYNQAPFPSNSFIEQFDNTNIQDPSTSFSMMPPQSTPPNHMQTPPPTRDASSRKRPQQTRFAHMTTPSTANARRMSAPGEPLQQQPPELQIPQISPAAFTPLQFSPPNPALMANLGPMTAPVYPQGGLFWDPNSSFNMNPASFSSINEDPFVTNPPMDESMYSFQRPATTTSFNIPPRYDSRSALHPAVTVQRPQSARPAESQSTSLSQPLPSAVVSASSVDPSVLWSAPPSTFTQSFYGMPDARSMISESRKPYELQLEQMRKEKETDRLKPSNLPPIGTETTLRRSLTDPRARKTGAHRHRMSHASESSSLDLQEVTRGLNEAPFPRTSSPLKRPKSYDHKQNPSPLKTPRRSIVLTVDEQGTARTEVTAVDDDGSPTRMRQAARAQAIVSESDEDSVELEMSNNNSRGSSRSGILLRPTSRPTSQSDAQSALREVVRDRRQKRLGEV